MTHQAPSTTRVRRIRHGALCALLAAGLLAGCSGSDSDAQQVDTSSEGCRSAADAQAETEAPDPEVPTADAEGIESTDDIEGCGNEVGPDDTVSVQYILKSRSSGEVVDSSWSRGEPFEVTLGQGAVIRGWDEGIPGMKVGGRRTLVLGPDYGYGEQGSPPAIAPGDTLVFVVDVLSVG